MTQGSPTNRLAGLDIARGGLLLAMLAVHVVSAHGPAGQINALHGYVGVFLISSGFVGLSGYVVGLRTRSLALPELGRGLDRGLQLVLVMFAYGVLLSLLRHGLLLAGSETRACVARDGWTPPLRFDDLGILLPIGIVQILGPLAGARARLAIPGMVALAVGSMILPALTADLDGNLILEILTRRTLTPFYTVTTFIAIGLVGVALGRARPTWLGQPVPPLVAATSGGCAIVLAIPPLSSAVIAPIFHAGGQLAGSLVTLAYWSGVLVLFVRAFAAWTPPPHGPIAGAFAVLGRTSLFVFVLHDLLLVLDGAVRDGFGLGKSSAVVLAMLVTNTAILLLAARGLDRSARARAWTDALLLGRSRPGSLVGGGAFSLFGGLVLAGVFAVYTSAALAGPAPAMVVDDFESADCPRWWTFGFLPSARVPAEAGAQGAFVLELRGSAPGAYAHGRGVFLARDIGERRHLVMLVRGEGPGSGRIKIELSEDDNGNWEIEKQPPLYVPLHDDRWVHELTVDWRGWREVTIPLALFRDDNPHAGNNVFDPARDLTSGGLLELPAAVRPDRGVRRRGSPRDRPSPLHAMIRTPRARTAAFAIFVTAAVAYLGWRVVFTLNPDAPIYSWGFFVLETYATTSAITFFAITLRRADRIPPRPPEGLAVDVLICTYNEPASLLRQTIRRAMAMRYPHRTYVCDDGRRPEIRALAAELGCDYITRDKNIHYKAGNLNNALAHTSGDYLVVLDADHLVRRELLDKLLGYFDEPQVALVQTPQVFYNLDSFQHHFRAAGRRLWHEGAIFHHAMQPGANRWNAAFFVGTGAIVRRSAVVSIGGFATGSVTEDAFTSMRLHAAGFRSVYHDEPLGYLIAPESLLQYLTQRLRWGQGSMQIMRLENPLFRRGLTVRQRILYTAALSSFTQSIVHLAYYLAPAVFLLGGPAPLRASDPLDFAPLVAHIAFDLVFFKLWLGPLARPLVAECFKFLNFYVFLKAIGGYFMRSGRLAFKVTTKGRDAGASLRLLAPQAALLLLNLTAFGYGVLRLSTSPGSLIAVLGVALATFFAGLFVIVGAMTFLFALERIAAEREYTFPDQIAAELRNQEGVTMPATVLRANDVELHLLATAGVPVVGEELAASLRLAADEPPLALTGRVMRVLSAAEGAIVELEVGELAPTTRDRLFDHLVDQAIPGLLDGIVQRWRTGGPPASDGPALYLPIQTDVL